MTPNRGESYVELAAPRAGSGGRASGLGPWIALGLGVIALIVALVVGAFLPGRELTRLERSLSPSTVSENASS